MRKETFFFFFRTQKRLSGSTVPILPSPQWPALCPRTVQFFEEYVRKNITFGIDIPAFDVEGTMYYPEGRNDDHEGSLSLERGTRGEKPGSMKSMGWRVLGRSKQISQFMEKELHGTIVMNVEGVLLPALANKPDRNQIGIQ